MRNIKRKDFKYLYMREREREGETFVRWKEKYFILLVYFKTFRLIQWNSLKSFCIFAFGWSMIAAMFHCNSPNGLQLLMKFLFLLLFLFFFFSSFLCNIKCLPISSFFFFSQLNWYFFRNLINFFQPLIYYNQSFNEQIGFCLIN